MFSKDMQEDMNSIKTYRNPCRVKRMSWEKKKKASKMKMKETE